MIPYMGLQTSDAMSADSGQAPLNYALPFRLRSLANASAKFETSSVFLNTHTDSVMRRATELLRAQRRRSAVARAIVRSIYNLFEDWSRGLCERPKKVFCHFLAYIEPLGSCFFRSFGRRDDH